MDFVSREPIVVRPGADAWGPFAFDLSPALPAGDDVSTCTVRSTLDSVETTTDLIETGSTLIVGNVVSVRFQYPGGTKTGNHALRFETTLESGAMFTFIFQYVLVV